MMRGSREPGAGPPGRCRPTVRRRHCSLLCAPTVALTATAIIACSDGVRPTATMQAADTADQVLFGMVHVVTTDGVVRARVRADTAFFYGATQRAELRHVTVTFYDLTGTESSTLTAQEGTYHWRTGDMEGRHDVLVVTTDGRRLTTDVLRFSQGRNQVTSDRPFVFDAPDRHIEGEGFTSDPSFKNVVALRPKGTGGRFTLPDQ